MNLISQVLRDKRKNSNCALIPFLTAGYPSIDLTIKALLTLDRQGADIIELGIPYSDALADGPLIQNASRIALNQGVYIEQVLYILSKTHLKIVAPIVIFTYYNPILVRGLSRFLREISQFGVKGLIIPDLPIEETDYVLCLCKEYKLELILFIAPTSSESRITNIINKAPGSVYLVSSTGVTGIRSSINYDINIISSYIKSKTDKLVMLGFGISSPAQVSILHKLNVTIDAIVVGSAFTEILTKEFNNSDKNFDSIEELGIFCKKMKLAMM
uniref:Tryptophan synthase alpha chain n=1 Tax=Polysiphonia sp. TaxID=1967842 RepID=A0A1Z1M3Z6_9FLOR|nr:Tryptophan synthase alpha subunit [Polysiphonia sp.]